jgi:hypothetical protein
MDEDEAVLRILGGANFGPDAGLILPSGKRLEGDEAQAWTSLYASDQREPVDELDATEFDNEGWAIPRDLRAGLAEAEAGRGITHKDGVPWFEAKVPRRWHRCWAQTSSRVDGVDRCACGAMRIDGSPWMERNSSRG